MEAVRSFVDYFRSTFKEETEPKSSKLSTEFFDDFIHYTPIRLRQLEACIIAGNTECFYKSLADLKYLVEFSDHFNRYWYLLRAYSGALTRLKKDRSVKGSKRVYAYYFENYGDRRILKNEHWFEEKRWEFLDELAGIYTETELGLFIDKYQHVLVKNYEIYVSYMNAFINKLRVDYLGSSRNTRKK